MSARVRRHPAMAVLGAGRAGGGLAFLLAGRDWPPVAIWSRRRGPAERLARRLAARTSSRPLATVRLDRAVTAARVLLLAVPDDALAHVARQAGCLGRGPRGGVALHLSGLHPAGVLAPLAAVGWSIGAVHPLAAFPPGPPPHNLLAGAALGVEGAPPAAAMARRIARLLGARPFSLPPSARPIYHLAASMVANDTVALFHLALELVRKAALPTAVLQKGLAHLLAGTARSLGRFQPAEVLTGPVARGDVQTLRRHLEAAPPDAVQELHVRLSRVLVDLSRTQGRLDAPAARRLRRLLASASREAGRH